MKVGKNTTISPKASFYNHENMEIGDNVRIDDFCILTGNVKIGNHIHIGAGSYLLGTEGIILEDFCPIAPRVCILSANDDWLGNSLLGPIFPMKYKTDYKKGSVLMKRHSGVCMNSTVLPGVTLHEGAILGSYSMAKEDCKQWSIYTGVPAKWKCMRPGRKMLKMESEFLEEYNRNNQ